MFPKIENLIKNGTKLVTKWLHVTKNGKKNGNKMVTSYQTC